MWLKKFVSLCLILIFPFNLFAQGKISPLNEGQKAPFDGILYDKNASKKQELYILDLELKLEEFKLKKEKEINELKIIYEGEIEKLKLNIKLNEKREKERLNLKNEHIEFLENELSKTNSNAYLWWYFGGVITGIVVSVAIGAISVWAVSEVGKKVEIK